MRLCLDTSAYSHFKRGDPQVVTLIDRAEWVGVPAVVLGELPVGFRPGSRYDRNRSELRAFLANQAVEVLPIDEEAGTPLPASDIWIAATAARWGAPLLTYDEHFASIGRVGSTVLRYSE